MRASLLPFCILAALPTLLSLGQPAIEDQGLVIAVTDSAGAPLPGAHVAVVLKSGEHQGREVADENGEVKFRKPAGAATLWVAADGCAAQVVKFPGGERCSIAMSRRHEASSTIAYGWTKLEGTGGGIEIRYADRRSPYVYATNLVFGQQGRKGEKLARFRPPQTLDALLPDGRSFKINIREGAQLLALVEYTLPE